MNLEDNIEQRVSWIKKRVGLSEIAEDLIKFQMIDLTKQFLNGSITEDKEKLEALEDLKTWCYDTCNTRDRMYEIMEKL